MARPVTRCLGLVMAPDGCATLEGAMAREGGDDDEARGRKDPTEENMVKLSQLTEAGILKNLHVRFEQEDIYTYVGTVLISVNPFRALPLYGPEWVDRFRRKGAFGEPPHVYAVADTAYRSLMTSWEDQSIIVSGESGSGKTEATKLVLEYLTEMSGRALAQNDDDTDDSGEPHAHAQRNGRRVAAAADGDGRAPLEEQCLHAQVVLEAFGNAKTLRNDNSSRFGKWIEVHLSRGGQIQGAVVHTYLLEKSRVVLLDQGERSYHIFYELLAGAQSDASLAAHLDLKGDASCCAPEAFRVLRSSGTYLAGGASDGEEFGKRCEALAAFGVAGDRLRALLHVVAGILHMGNVEFDAHECRAAEAAQDGSAVSAAARPALERSARQLGVSAADLEAAMVTRSWSGAARDGDEPIRIPRKPHEAADARDALMKALYSGLFGWLRNIINRSLDKRDGGDGAGAGDKDGCRAIGILDIFGFEILQNNGFEQLCINYCNEKLQAHFNEVRRCRLTSA